jgi:methyl-accepting chemotaxis protein
MKIGDILRKVSVTQKVTLLMVAMLIVAGVNIGVVFYYQSQVEEDSNAIDTAGQQRMLTQQMTRYANRLAAGDEEAREPLRASKEKYQSNLDALDTGGTVDGTSVPAVPGSARDELQKEQAEWESFRANVETVLTGEPGTEEFEAALTEIQAESNGLLSTSDDLVTSLSAANSQQIGFMQQLLLVLLAVNFVVFILGIYISRAYVGKPLKTLDAVAADIAGGDLATDVKGAHPHFGAGSDEIAGLATTVESLRENVRERIEDAEAAESEADAARQDAEQARQEAERMNSHLEKKAAAFSTTMEEAADGDLTQRMDETSRSEAMADIATAFNTMIDELEATVAQIQSFALEVAASSQEVTVSTEESQNASEQVSESIQAISADANKQSENLNDVMEEMQSLSGTVEEVAASADEVADKSEATAARGRESREAASQAMDEMTNIKTRSTETIDEINSLASEIQEISEIVELITDIAEQTNMLALNASIEAARAGEAGEGFAVVADEIKQLAGEVGEATEEVDSLISDIQSSTNTAVTDIEKMGESVESGTETIENALNALEEMAENVEKSNQSIQEISAATDDQAASTEEVATMIDTVVRSADKVSSESENVSAASEEQTSSLAEVSQTARTLTEQADELQDMLSEFVVREDTTQHSTKFQGTTANTPEASVDGGKVAPDNDRHLMGDGSR